MKGIFHWCEQPRRNRPGQGSTASGSDGGEGNAKPAAIASRPAQGRRRDATEPVRQPVPAAQQPGETKKTKATKKPESMVLSAERRKTIQRLFRRRQLAAMKLHQRLLTTAASDAEPVAVEQVCCCCLLYPRPHAYYTFALVGIGGHVGRRRH